MTPAAPVETDTETGTETVIRRAWAGPLWAHAAVLLLILLALLPVMSPNSSFASDEGAYALQVQALERGSWAYDYRAGDLDPEGRYFPIYLSTKTASGYYPYVKHPAYPLLLQAARRLAGPTLGLHALALLGTIGTAAAAWLLAGELDARLRRPAFWVAAAGPVLVNGFLIWAHAPSAAAAGFALVGGARIARRRFTPLATIGVSAALVVGVLLRSEGLLFAGALALALAWFRFKDGAGARSLVPLLLAAPAGLAALGEREWIRAIAGGGYETMALRRGRSSLLSGRLSGASHELVQGHGQDPSAGLPVLLALGLIVGLGYLALRRWDGRSRRDLFIAAAGTLLLLLVRMATRPYEPVTGLFAAWPVGLLGLLLFRRRQGGRAGSLLWTASLLFALAVLATQYPEGGAVEWGGRFLSPALAPLAVLASTGLAAALSGVPRAQVRLVTALLATLTAATAAFGLITTGLERARLAGITRAVSRHPSPVTVTTRAVLPRAGWPADSRVTWLYADEADLPALLGYLRARGAGQVSVVTMRAVPASDLSAFPRVEELPEVHLRNAGLRLFIARV